MNHFLNKNYTRLLMIGIISAVLVSNYSYGQTKGIHFEDGVSWEAIKAKAKTEKKYIFVDCFASWCAPCKWMDEHIYAVDTLGDFINQHFVSAKIQFDSTAVNANINGRYATAQVFAKAYQVSAYPTYLFFGPDGNIVSEDVGVRNLHAFYLLVKGVLNPKNQFFILLNKYNAGERNYETMPELIRWLQRTGKSDLEKKLFADYMDNYFLKASEAQQFYKQNLVFITSLRDLLSTQSSVFEFLIKNKAKVDGVLGEGFSDMTVDYAITNDLIDPAVATWKEEKAAPQWNHLFGKIKIKYGDRIADRNLVAAKIKWYAEKKDWGKYVRYIIENISKYYGSTRNTIFLNNCAYEVCKHTNRKQDLEKALAWSSTAMNMQKDTIGFMLDTKACLLFKLGQRHEGLDLERKAVRLDPNNKELQTNLQRMAGQVQIRANENQPSKSRR